MIPTPEQIKTIYAGIDQLPLEADTQGWNSDGPIFSEVIGRTMPKVIIEVGSWRGGSAVHMGHLCRSLGLQPVIYCVDLWVPPIGVGLGGFPETHIPDRFDAPSFYEQFLFNIKKRTFDDMIVPVRGLTKCVAWCLNAWGLKAQAIYLDASHDELSVSEDLASYWPLLAPGGLMFGDDYSSHPGVKAAVDRFADQHSRKVREFRAREGTQWLLE